MRTTRLTILRTSSFSFGSMAHCSNVFPNPQKPNLLTFVTSFGPEKPKSHAYRSHQRPIKTFLLVSLLAKRTECATLDENYFGQIHGRREAAL